MNTLTPRQLRAITAIADADSISAAAESCGTNRATLHRWMRLPQFIDALAEIQADQRARAVRRLSGALDRVAAHVVYLADHASDEAIQLRAAIAVPQMLREVLELSSASTSAIVIDSPAPANPEMVFDHGAAVRSMIEASERSCT